MELPQYLAPNQEKLKGEENFRGEKMSRERRAERREARVNHRLCLKSGYQRPSVMLASLSTKTSKR
jgi:hypothetical protein